MKSVLITIGSVTTATRLARLAERKLGIPAQVIHTPAVINHGSCSYAIRIRDKHTAEVRKLAKEYKVPVRKCYTEETVDGKRVYHAVS